jgi:MerR family transcriptional regulator, light-induced transcriptional regulator
MQTMEYSIKDLENLSQIKAHTIRIWEKRYGIIKPARTQTNIRYYSDEELRKLLNITILVNNGVKISHIANFSPNELKEKAFFLLQNPNDTENQIKNLVISMIELNEIKFEKILSKSIINNGFEKTMLNLIYPFLKHIGVLWQTGSINPAQEHFMTNLIRQKLISSIDTIDFKANTNNQRFILFLPEGEWHELGLLFYQYLLKVRGHEVLYLGQSTPTQSIFETVEIWPANYLLLFLTTSFSGISHENYLSELAQKLPDSKIIAAGLLISEINANLPANILLVKDSLEFISLIEKIGN